MEDMDMAHATGPTPTAAAKSASEHLNFSLDHAIVRQREKDYLTAILAVAGALIAAATIGALVAYVAGGSW